MFKIKLQDIIDDRVMSKHKNRLQWVAPLFCRPKKKDDCIRIVTDFQELLNKRVLQKQHPLPKILQDIIQQQSGYKYFTKLDISMQYWCFELNDNIGCWSNRTYKEHMSSVLKILKQLAKNILKTNPLKCEWAVEQTYFLGYIMTPRCVA